MKETGVSQGMSSSLWRALPGNVGKDIERNGESQPELTEPQSWAEFSGQGWVPGVNG